MLPCCAPAQTTVSQHSVGQTRCIRDGDLVIVYEGHSSMKAVHVNSKERFDNKFGSFAQKDWLGLPFGSKVHARSGVRGWVHLLAPSPTLWSLVLPHRTQILYIADISMVCLHLDLAPGCVVLESGTGSASLTHSLVRAVAPLGHVHTFEFHSGRAEEAAKELARNGLSPWVTVRQRNIEQDGFPCAMSATSDAALAASQQPEQQPGQQPEQKPEQKPGQQPDQAPQQHDGGPDLPDQQVDMTAVSAPEQATVPGLASPAPALVEPGPVQKPLSAPPTQQAISHPPQPLPISPLKPTDLPVGAAEAVKAVDVDLTGQADAVFLDLPAPQKAIPSAARCLKPNGRQVLSASSTHSTCTHAANSSSIVWLCSFSPCIEQVHRTCEALELHGFIDLQTVECLLRMYDVRSEHLITSFGPEQGNQRQHKQHKQNLMQRQPDKAPQEAGAASTTADSLALPDAKRARTQDATGALESGDTPVGAGASGTPAAGMLPSTVQRNSVTTHVTAKPVVDARGHTGYLTFARKFV